MQKQNTKKRKPLLFPEFIQTFEDKKEEIVAHRFRVFPKRERFSMPNDDPDHHDTGTS